MFFKDLTDNYPAEALIGLGYGLSMAHGSTVEFSRSQAFLTIDSRPMFKFNFLFGLLHGLYRKRRNVPEAALLGFHSTFSTDTVKHTCHLLTGSSDDPSEVMGISEEALNLMQEVLYTELGPVTPQRPPIDPLLN